MLMDLGDVDSEWWFRRAADGRFPGRGFFLAEAKRLRSAEADAVRKAAACVVASETAADLVRALGPVTSPTIIPNGVNVDSFVSSARAGSAPTVVFSASLSNAADIREAAEFSRVVLPLVKARIRDTRFVVYSRDPVPTGGLGAQLAGAEVVGAVTDVRPLLHTGAVAVASGRRGSDVRSTVLEPLAAGIPVVASSGVREQLAPGIGHALRVADDPSDVAGHLVELLEDSRARAAAGAAGRSYVVAHYGWTVVTAGLSEIAEAATGATRAPGSTHESVTRAGQ
jgi:glycosyltransferase involved in cell wall biosynthesis